jgi:hypothetical protein
MKMFVNEGMNKRQVGIALHVADSTVPDRLERAAAKMRRLDSADGPCVSDVDGVHEVA